MGSWLAITDNSGSLKNHYNYDAWGRRRDPVTWKLCPINPASASIGGSMLAMQPRFDRGYTGHEQMAGFALINMNGRMYDPYLQRFLSPDNEIQAPGDAQSYNRYTYCMNNPLRFTDPTGYTWGIFKWVGNNWHSIVTVAVTVGVTIAVAAICASTCGLGAVAIAAIAGAAGGFAGGVVGTALNGGNFGQCLSAGGLGALTGAVFGAVGGFAATLAPPGALWGAVYGALTSGTLGGMSSSLQGGSVWSGFAMGAIFGGIGGGISGYLSAQAQGLDPWTGAKLPPPQIDISTIIALPTTSTSLNTDGMRIQTLPIDDEDEMEQTPENVYHYTNSENIPGIKASGLNPSSDGNVYTTPDGSLTPNNVNQVLNLSPGVRNAVYQLNVQGLYNATGILPAGPATPILGGSGYEIKFNVGTNGNIPAGPYLILFKF